MGHAWQLEWAGLRSDDYLVDVGCGQGATRRGATVASLMPTQ